MRPHARATRFWHLFPKSSPCTWCSGAVPKPGEPQAVASVRIVKLTKVPLLAPPPVPQELLPQPTLRLRKPRPWLTLLLDLALASAIAGSHHPPFRFSSPWGTSRGQDTGPSIWLHGPLVHTSKANQWQKHLLISSPNTSSSKNVIKLDWVSTLVLMLHDTYLLCEVIPDHTSSFHLSKLNVHWLKVQLI